MEKEKNEYPVIAKIFIIVFFITSLGYLFSNWISLNILAPILAIIAVILVAILAIHDAKKKKNSVKSDFFDKK